MRLTRMASTSLIDRLRRIFLLTICVLLALAAFAYGIDYLVFRIRSASHGSAYDSVIVKHYYAVLLKNGKTEFIFDPPAPQTCVKALFPHEGWLPCWYLKKHPEQRTDI